MKHERLEALLKAAEDHVELFDDRTTGFLEDMMDKLDQWGVGIRVTEKQEAWLKSVEAELKRNGVEIEDE